MVSTTRPRTASRLMVTLQLLRFGLAEAYSNHGVCFFRNAFSPSECDRLVEMMQTRPIERDVRPDQSVSRVNYWDNTENRISNGDGACPYDWVYERILEKAREEETSQQEASRESTVQWGFQVESADVPTFSRKVDFVLMHEFKGADFFDWHVDTKPGDGTGRTININVMLSDAADHLGGEEGKATGKEKQEGYVGGELRVGECTLRPKRGDLYWYPANYPHKVEDVESGTRHTLVVAIQTTDSDRERSDYWQRGLANLERLTTGVLKKNGGSGSTGASASSAVATAGGSPQAAVEVKPSPFSQSMAATEAAIEAGREAAAVAARKRRVPSKWHWLHSELLQRMPGREADSDDALAQAYAATAQAAAYAQHFDDDGQRLVAGGKLADALPFFVMAARVESYRAARDGDGANPLYESHVEAIRAALKNSP